MLRIELFDPDSINQDAADAAVSYTDIAVANGFPASPETLACLDQGGGAQTNSCFIKTNEDNLVQTVPGIEPEQVNPVWFVRVDENRGTGSPGVCGHPATYTPAYNTNTMYALSYDRQNSDGSTERIDLARYTGQVGDNARDTGEHQTDLHWVSPGGTQGLGQPAFVPVDPGSE